MRFRLTVADDATGLRSDAVVECAPADPAAVVLQAVAAALPVRGEPVVDGRRPDPGASAAQALGEGALLHYGVPSTGARPGPVLPVLRVASGPSAGAELVLRPGVVLDVGRGGGCALVLDDPEVSRRHAGLRLDADGVEIADCGSVNGVLVQGRPISGPHRLPDGAVVRLGDTLLVLEAAGPARALIGPAADGGLLVHAPDPPPPARRSRWRRPSPAEEDAALRVRLPDPATVVRVALERRAGLWSCRGGPELRLGTADRAVRGRAVLRAAPVGVDLDALGAAGLAGPEPVVLAQLSWALVQLAVRHPPDALRVVVLAPDADEGGLGWVRWLPHARDGAGRVLAGWDAGGVQAAARAALEGPQGGPGGSRGTLVVLAGADPSGPVAALLSRPDVRALWVAPDPRLLPPPCRAVLAPGAGLRVDATTTALVPDGLPPGAAERVARSLAPLRPSTAPPAAAPYGGPAPRAFALPWFAP